MSYLINDQDTEQWRNALDYLKEDFSRMCEMTEGAYYHFLGCVPPKKILNGSFVCGEPYTHLSTGEGVYLCCMEENGRYFAQYGTVKQFSNYKLFSK